MQKERGQSELNGKLNEADTLRYCTLEKDASEALSRYKIVLGSLARSVHKVLRLARTIADLAEVSLIGKAHLMEALSFRKR